MNASCIFNQIMIQFIHNAHRDKATAMLRVMFGDFSNGQIISLLLWVFFKNKQLFGKASRLPKYGKSSRLPK